MFRYVIPMLMMFFFPILLGAQEKEVTNEVPAGLYVLIRPGTVVSEEILSSKLISGVVLRGDWPTIEPTPGRLLVDYYLTQLDRIHAAGKVASLVINNGGINTPKHVLDGVSQFVEFKNQNRFHKTYGKNISIPVFWDPHLLQEKERFVESLAKRLSHHPALSLISVQCANATTDDWNIPVSADWKRVGFSEEKLFRACQRVIDHSALNFPKQSLRMAVGVLPKALSERRQSVSRKISHYVKTHYSDKFYLQRHNLSAKTPIAGDNKRMFGWQLIYDARPFSAAQLLWPLTDETSCRMNGGETPCDSSIMLKKVSAISESYGFRYVEIYGADFKKLAQQDSFVSWAKSAKRPQTAVVSNDLRNERAPRQKPRLQLAKQRESSRDAQSLSSDSYGSWYNPPSSLNQRNITSHHSFVSRKLDRKVGYSLYLPKAALLDGERLPVIYWLHGKNGNETGGTHIAGYLDSAIAQGHIRPTAMVFVNGGRHSFYANSFNGKHPVESMIVEELIPHVESNHPVSNQRSGRLLEGFSMGGFGALKLAAKYPDKFGSVAIFGAALLDETFMPRRADVSAYENVFNSDAEYFIGNTPRYWLEKNADLISTLDLAIRIRSGSKDGTRRYNDHMHLELDKLKIRHDFSQYEGVRHAPRQYYDADDYGSFKFHELSMKKLEAM